MKKKEFYLLIILFLFAVITRVVFLLFFTDVFQNPMEYVVSDMYAYYNRALKLSNFTRDSILSYHSVQNSGYPVFIALVFWLVKLFGLSGFKLQILLLVQVFLQSLVVVFVYLITYKITNKKSLSILASLITSVHFLLIYQSLFLMRMVLFTPLFWLFIYLLFTRGFSRKNMLLLGFISGFLFFVRTDFLLFLFLFVIFSWFYSSGLGSVKKRTLRKNLLYLLPGFSLILLINLLVNYFSFGLFPFFSNTLGPNLIISNCELRGVKFVDNNNWFIIEHTSHLFLPKSRIFVTNVPFYNTSFYIHKALSCIKDNPMQLLHNFKHIYFLFFGGLFPISKPHYLFYRLSLYLTYLFMLPIALVYLLFFFKNIIVKKRSNHRNHKISIKERTKEFYFIVLLLPFLSMMFLSYFVVPGEPRYLLPYIPSIIILFVLAIYELPKKFPKIFIPLNITIS